LPHHDFGDIDLSTEEGQEELTEYACESIWGSGGVFTWDSNNPSQSTYAITDEVTGITTTHTVSEIFNGTWITNDYNNHKLFLNNTQDTDPIVFDWADVEIDFVNIASNTTAGIVKIQDTSAIHVDSVDGSIDVKLKDEGGILKDSDTGELYAEYLYILQLITL
jgi:hypothetical protein